MAGEQKAYHSWQPIEDLPASFEALARPELRSLSTVWKEQRTDLQDSDALVAFNDRLLRRWAVETGLIERVYTLDRGITQLLVERGLHANLIPQRATDQDPELVIRMIRDQRDVAEGLFDFVASRRPLSASYVQELHAALTASQQYTHGVDALGRPTRMALRKGAYKQRTNNPLRPDGTFHEYCPPEHVASEMDRLVEMYHGHASAGVPPEIEAAWLHHRSTQIHPFQDGNGRVARALATLVFLKEALLPPVVSDDLRAPYIGALEEADAGDLAALTDLFARLEKKALLEALSVALEVRDLDESVHRAVEAMRDTFERRHESLRTEWEKSRAYADRLSVMARDILRKAARDLDVQVAPLAPPGQEYVFLADHEAA